MALKYLVFFFNFKNRSLDGVITPRPPWSLAAGLRPQTIVCGTFELHYFTHTHLPICTFCFKSIRCVLGKLARCVLGPWPRAFLSLTSRGSVLVKSVLGLGLGFFFFCSWSRALVSPLHVRSVRITSPNLSVLNKKKLL